MVTYVSIAYPRSGSTMIQYLLRCAQPSIRTEKLHGHDTINNKIEAWHTDTILIMLLRNYKECIMSHLSRHGNQYKPERIDKGFAHYMRVLEVYDRSTVPKTYLYYEDFIQQPHQTLRILAQFVNTNVDHIINNMDFYLTQSKQHYMNSLGDCQTSGKQAIFFTPLTKEYDFNWDDRMKAMNPKLYQQFLSRYEEQDD